MLLKRTPRVKEQLKPELDSKVQEGNIKTISHGDLLWMDVVPPTPAAMNYLAERFQFAKLALEDCLSHRQISKMDVFPGYLFFVFHFNHYNKQTRVSTKKQWSAFIGENYIITIHTGELKAIGEVYSECEANSQTREELFSKGSGYVLYRIIDHAVDTYFPVLDKIMNLLEETEDNVFDQDADAATELSILRRDIITQRMVMFPTRTLLIEMKNKISRYSKVDITQEWDDLIDHLNRICQTLDECEEVVEVFKDTDYILVTQRLNRVVRILNIFATIVLPFLAISSIYGMNIPLPGGLERGSLNTFMILFALMAFLTLAMLYYFRRRKWI